MLTIFSFVGIDIANMYLYPLYYNQVDSTISRSYQSSNWNNADSSSITKIPTLTGNQLYLIFLYLAVHLLIVFNTLLSVCYLVSRINASYTNGKFEVIQRDVSEVSRFLHREGNLPHFGETEDIGIS